MRRSAATISSLVLMGGLMLTGCSGSSTLDGSTLQDELTTQIGQQLGGTWTVTCPSAEPIKQGGTFKCTATDSAGAAQTVDVTQTDDQGNISWEIASTGLDTAKLESGVASDLGTQLGGTWTVSCPSDVAIEKGGTFTCDATSADGQSSTINVTQTDDQGNVTWEQA